MNARTRRSAYLAALELKAAQLARLEVESRIGVAVDEARDQGLTWERIGELLGMTRQGAHKRYGVPGASTRLYATVVARRREVARRSEAAGGADRASTGVASGLDQTQPL